MVFRKSDSNLTVVLYSLEDAQRFLDESPNVDRLFTLTPDAQAIVKNIQIPLLTTLDTYSDYGHRCALARTRRMERKMKNYFNYLDGLSIAAKETLDTELHVHSTFSTRLWETLKGTGPWLIPTLNRWQRIDRLQEVHRNLLVHITSSQKSPLLFGYHISFWSPIIKALSRGLLRMMKKHRVVLLTAYSYGLSSLAQELKHRHIPAMSVTGSRGNFHEIINIFLNLFRIIIGNSGSGRISYTVVPTYSKNIESAITKYLDHLKDPVLKPSIDLLKRNVIRDIVLTDGLNREIEVLVRGIQPKAVLAHTFRWGSSAMLGEVSRRYQIPSILISHGSHPKPENVTSSYEHYQLAGGLLFSRLACENLLQSPHAKQAANSFNRTDPFSSFRPIMWGYRKLPSVKKNEGIRTILHAGTYKRWYRTRPWVFETSDEFIAGLVTLVRAVEHLEQTKLVIRVRPQPECQIESLEKLLPQSDCYFIKTSGTFLEDLAKADLLLSYASTTIEEALYSRRPVLLWGGSQRYLHLPASKTRPTANFRSAVYAPENEEQLSPMIKAILDFHAGKPLTDDELKGHIWFEDTPGKEELLQRMCD